MIRELDWFLELDAETRSFDEYTGLNMILARCQNCDRCWAMVRDGKLINGPKGVMCFYGGPYNGWLEVL